VKILLDENTPVQLQPALQQVLGDGHAVDHVDSIKWKSKKDKHLIPDAAGRGYQVFVTKDSNQLQDPGECSVIKKSAMHHVRFSQGKGLKGMARAMGSVIAALPDVIEEVEEANGQLLVRIQGLAPRRRHETIDPKVDPPTYWP